MNPIQSAEQVASTLRAVYNRYGYRQYKMSKFEEYDLYARNKDFLISDSVITFTDLSGKLLALKPDVTLSIVKNSKDSATVQKLYYNENVYRVTKGAQGFREIPQLGLECLGPVDDYCISEVLTLAATTLRQISDLAVLDISHLGILSEVLSSIGIADHQRGTVAKLIGEKNLHELTALCRELNVSEEGIALLRQLLTLRSPLTGSALSNLLTGYVKSETLTHFNAVLSALAETDLAPLLRIDFSVVDDISYYNGFVFKGFVSGLPGSILSGGQYDKLMKKMSRTDRAIGFAVYLDMLQQLEQPDDGRDVDTLILYDATTPLSAIRARVAELTAQGQRVMAQQTLPDNIRYQALETLSAEVKENA